MTVEEMLDLMRQTKTDLQKLKAVLRAAFEKEAPASARLIVAKAFWALHEAEMVVEELRNLASEEKSKLN
jgi:hypothetical protein